MPAIAAACVFCVGIVFVARVVTQKLVPTDAPAAKEHPIGLPPRLHEMCTRPADCGGLTCVQWQGLPFVKWSCELPCTPNAVPDSCPAPTRCVMTEHGAGAHCQE